MGDSRFARAYERVRSAKDRAQAIRTLSDDEVIQALAAASRDREPFLANVLATEAQNRIRRSRTVTQHLAEGAISIDDDMRLTSVNPAMASLVGAEVVDLLGAALEDVLLLRNARGDPLTGTPACPLRRVLEGDGVIELEGSIERLGRAPVPVSIIVGPIEREGRVEGAVAAFRDTRERRALEAELAKTAARLGTALLSLSEGVLVLSRDGEVVEANAAAESILGLSREMLKDPKREPPLRHLLRLDGTRIAAEDHLVQRALTRREPILREVVRLQTPHRGLVTLQISAMPVEGNGVVVTFADVTDEHERRVELEFERSLLGQLIETMPIGVMIADAEGRLKHVNAAAQRIWGRPFPLEEPVDYAQYRALDPLTQAPLAAADWALAKAVRTKEAVLDQDVMIQAFDGRTRRILNSALPLRDRQGRIQRFVVLNVDLTEREQMHDQREAVFDAALDAIVTIDADGIVRAWNTAAEEMFDRRRDEALGRELAELIVPERFRERHRAGLRRLHDEPDGDSRLLGRRYRLPALRRDGSEFAAEISIVRVPGAQTRFTGFVRDVSGDHFHADRAILAEGQYAAVVEKISDYAIFHVNLDGRITSWNEGCRRIKGYEEHEFIGLPFAALFTEEQRVQGEPERELTAALQTGHVHTTGWRLRKDGTPFFADVDLTLVRNAAGDPAGFVKVTRDLTERHQLDERLDRRVRERTQELQAVNRDLEAFTNTASHDLRAPLRGIMMLTEELMHALDRGDTEEAKDLARLIRHEDERAVRLVRALLAFAQSGRADLHPQDVDVTSMARELAADILRRHPDRRTRFEVQEGLRARADPALLRIALDNLLSNASKYSNKAAEPLVRVTGEANGGETVLHVADNGVGFPSIETPRLFGAFQRLSTANGFEGTGLGLVAASRVVKRHGGRIWAESELGRGATFHVALPRKGEEGEGRGEKGERG